MTLNSAQRAVVARAVMGRPYLIDGDGQIRLHPPTSDPSETFWRPGFEIKHGITTSRSQALALAEWLADRIKAIDTTEDRLVFTALTFIEAITERDASKLEILVLELLESNNG